MPFAAAPPHAKLSAAAFTLSVTPLGCSGLRWKQKRLVVTTARTRRSLFLWNVKSVLHENKSSISDNGATDPAKILLERLFTQTQKLEEHIARDPQQTQVAELGLGNLESDLQAALEALKKKEEDLQDAERKVLLDCNELDRARAELAQREERLSAAKAKQEKLEEELRQANLVLASQARELEDLKLTVKERDQDILAVQSALSLKEDEIKKMNCELMQKSEEAAIAESDLRSKSQLLDETNGIVKKQEAELQELRRVIEEKEAELKASIMMQKTDAEKLKVIEENLEKQSLDWLVAQEELKKLAEEASENSQEANKTREDFIRVRKLLDDVRTELLSSQNALASSRKKMKDQETLLQEQLEELEEQRQSIAAYINNLRDAKIEVESERVKLRVAEARNKELGRELSMEKELVKKLQDKLDEQRSFLEQALQEKSFLQEELELKSNKFQEIQDALDDKQSELVEARLEIHNLKSAQASLHLMLEEKDLELSSARKKLEEVNQEIMELRLLMNGREEEVTLAMAMIKEKDEHMMILQHELRDSKLKSSEAEKVVEQIVDLSNKLATSAMHDNPLNSILGSHLISTPLLWEETNDGYEWRMRQLETEIEFTRGSLREKEMEVLNAQRVLTVKDEELRMVLDRLDAREKQVREMKEEISSDNSGLKQLHALSQEKIGDKSIKDLTIQRLQLGAAELEIEAATSALHKLVEMSRDLLNKAGLSIACDTGISEWSSSNMMMMESKDYECLSEVKNELARLSALSEQLVREAGIVESTGDF